MADFAAVLKKTLEQMGETSPEARGKVYDKARETVRRQIESMEKAPPQAAVDRQFEKLEEAINSVEVDYAPDEEVAELDALLDDVVEEAPDQVEDVAEEFATEPDEDIDPEIAKEAEAEAEAEAESESEFDVEAEPAPMLTPDEVVAEVTNVSPEEMAQFAADEEVASDAADDPLADFISEHSASDPEVDSVDEAAADLISATSAENDDVLGEITPERDAGAAVVNDSNDGLSGSAAAGLDEGGGGGAGRLIKVLVVLGVLGGGGYYAYANQETVKSWWDGVTGASTSESTDASGSENASGDDVPVRTVTTTTVDGTDTAENSETASEETEVATAAEPANVATDEQQPKFTQRLTEDGTEVDEGPAVPVDATVEVAEGSSVAEQSSESTELAQTDPAPGADESAAVVVPEPATASDSATGTPVGQRAIFYEERTGSQEGTALAGATIWSVANESPGGDLPVEPAIRAETTIPELGIEMEMTIRRNGDSTFPASHIVELFFTVPETFEGRGIADVQRVTFKSVEQDPGNALIAVPAPIDQNIFMIALTDATTAVDTNVNLMKREKWIDIPMQYTSGRRALITLEKGIPGERVFNEVFAAWDSAPIN